MVSILELYWEEELNVCIAGINTEIDYSHLYNFPQPFAVMIYKWTKYCSNKGKTVDFTVFFVHILLWCTLHISEKYTMK